MAARTMWVFVGIALACGQAHRDRGPTSTPVCEGVALNGAAALQQFAELGCVEVTGTLAISGDDVTKIALPTITKVENLEIRTGTELDLSAVEHITGQLTIADAPLAFVWLPSLTNAGDLVFVRNLLRSVVLPNLVTARTLTVAFNGGIATLSVPALREFTGASCPSSMGCFNLIIEGEPALRNVDLPSLTSAQDGIFVYAVDGAMARLQARALTSVGWLYLYRGPPSLDLPALTDALAITLDDTQVFDVFFPALTDVRGFTDGTGGLEIFHNWLLGSIRLPVLRSARSFQVSANFHLTSLSAPLLASVPQTFDVEANYAYANCAALALLAQLASVPATATVSANDMTATCAP